MDQRYTMTRETFLNLQHEIYLKEEVEAYEKVSKIEVLTAETLKNGGRSLMRNTGFNKERWTTLFKKTPPKGPSIRTWSAQTQKIQCYLYSERVRGGCCEHNCGYCRRAPKTMRDYEGIAP